MHKFAGIQYLGEAGMSHYCKEAVIKLIHSGDRVAEVKILTAGKEKHSRSHCLLITDDNETTTAIKSGFTSGYLGEGPKTLSYVLTLLRKYTDEIAEFKVTQSILEKIDNSCLTLKELENINSLKSIHPAEWFEYTYDIESHDVFNDFPLELPLALIDDRIIDFALKFSSNPDSEILNAYRLLESVVRKKSGLKHESSTKLFSKAFLEKESILYWGDIDSGESKGRALLFNSVYLAYRNKRAHQEPNHSFKDDLKEFMLINQLFTLESESVLRK